MSHLFGVGLNIETNRIINDFRMQLQKKKGLALRALSLALYARGDHLSSDDLEKVLASFNIFPTKVQLQTLMKSFDDNGSLSVDSFMAHLRPKLTDRRAAVCASPGQRSTPLVQVTCPWTVLLNATTSHSTPISLRET